MRPVAEGLNSAEAAFYSVAINHHHEKAASGKGGLCYAGVYVTRSWVRVQGRPGPYELRGDFCSSPTDGLRPFPIGEMFNCAHWDPE
jgi:hypothetical protein